MKKMMSEYGGKEMYPPSNVGMRGERKPKTKGMKGKGYAKGGMVVKIKGKNC